MMNSSHPQPPSPLPTWFFFLMLTLLAPLTIAAPAQGQGLLPPKPGTPAVITSFDDILKWVPRELMPKKGATWSQPQMDRVNELLKQRLAAQPCILEMKVPVAEIPSWGGKPQIFSEVPNRLGYSTRVFAVVAPGWTERLAGISIGSKVTVKGKITEVTYGVQWNKFALMLVAEDCTFEK